MHNYEINSYSGIDNLRVAIVEQFIDDFVNGFKARKRLINRFAKLYSTPEEERDRKWHNRLMMAETDERTNVRQMSNAASFFNDIWCAQLSGLPKGSIPGMLLQAGKITQEQYDEFFNEKGEYYGLRNNDNACRIRDNARLADLDRSKVEGA